MHFEKSFYVNITVNSHTITCVKSSLLRAHMVPLYTVLSPIWMVIVSNGVVRYFHH